MLLSKAGIVTEEDLSQQAIPSLLLFFPFITSSLQVAGGLD